jgi:hypothetical protein
MHGFNSMPVLVLSPALRAGGFAVGLTTGVIRPIDFALFALRARFVRPYVYTSWRCVQHRSAALT